MQVLAVNVGEPRAIQVGGRSVLTGIFKQPVSGPVAVARRNLAGDRQADLTVHGGVDKAVYAYPYEHYAIWAARLDRDDFEYGQFGENLTTEGLLEADVLVGEQFRIGTATLEASQPRMPCFKLGIRMANPGFVKQFFAEDMSGIYFRVVEEGTVQAGDSIESIFRPQDSATVSTLNAVGLGREKDPDLVAHALNNPYLANAWKGVIRDFAGN